MAAADVVRYLRLLTSPQWKRTRRFPVATIAQLAGVSRETVYQARRGNSLTPRVVAVLEPVLAAIVEGKVEVTRGRWYWSVKDSRMEERRFSMVGDPPRLPLGPPDRSERRASRERNGRG